MSRKQFFDVAREKMFGGALSQDVVADLDAILDAWERYGDGDANKLAYLLATGYHESDRFKTMEEYANGKAYENRRDLGNIVSGDGMKFKGRGYVQITGRRNYQDWSRRLGIDLLKEPKRVSERVIAARILVEGSMLGTFTGKKLGDYIGSTKADLRNARRVINGTDRADLIAGYARKFIDAVKAMGAPLVAAAQEARKPELGGAPQVDYTVFARGHRYALLEKLQRLLAAKGYHGVGEADGKWGSMTRNSANAFRADNGQPADDAGADVDNTIALLEAATVRVLPERAQATVADVAPKSEIIPAAQAAASGTATTGIIGSVGAGAGTLVAAIPNAADSTRWLREYFPAWPIWVWLLIALVVAAVPIVIAWKAKRKAEQVVDLKVSEYRTGGRA